MASLDHKDEEGSVNNLKVNLEHALDDDRSISRQKQSRCSSSLSNSSAESVVLEENSENGTADDTFESKQADNNEPPAFSISSDFAYPSPVWSFQNTTTPQCPPTQMMARPGYDPNRIPMSIFSSKPTNPSAWSHVSNESDLFSIQAGNNSFTTDNFFLGNKSVESPRLDESTSKSMALHPVEDVVPSNCADNDIEERSDSVSTRVACEETKDSAMAMHCQSVKTLAERETVLLPETPVDNSKEAMAPMEEAKNITSSVSHRSEESHVSNKSFPFSLLSSIQGGRKSKVAVKSKKQEEEKSLEAPSGEAEKAPSHRLRKRWYSPSCCRSPWCCEGIH